MLWSEHVESIEAKVSNPEYHFTSRKVGVNTTIEAENPYIWDQFLEVTTHRYRHIPRFNYVGVGSAAQRMFNRGAAMRIDMPRSISTEPDDTYMEETTEATKMGSKKELFTECNLDGTQKQATMILQQSVQQRLGSHHLVIRWEISAYSPLERDVRIASLAG